MIEHLLKYLNTIRYLRVTQIIGRLTRQLKRVDVSLVDGWSTRKRVQPFTRIKLNKHCMLHADRFRFLGQEGSITDWNDSRFSTLWLYNLHYFDDLNSADSASRHSQHVALIESWIAENPPTKGVGWDPYPTSLRIVNWIKWLLASGNATENQLQSLSLQAKVLSQTLETHLQGNHLFANAKALLFAGLYFKGKDADAWLDLSLEIFRAQIPEQVLGDGGHFELSPMYHAIISADLLDMISILAAYQNARCADLALSVRERLPKMLRWLAVMTHPDGHLALFNDSATNIAPTLTQLVQAAQKVEVQTNHTIDTELISLEDSGYFRLNLNDAVVIGDVGKVGPDYIPGHAHADTLSFELSVFGSRLIVNSGTSLYGENDERYRQRGTAAHSTVMVNGENSSEVWGSFRVARRANPCGLRFDTHRRLIRCGHDGYKRLPGKPVHTREWHYSDRSIKIVDHLVGEVQHAEARYYFHPDWECQLNANTLLCTRGHRVVRIHVKSGSARLESTTYHQEFGLCVKNTVLIVTSKIAAEVVVQW